MIIKGAFTGAVFAIIGIVIFEGTGGGMGFVMGIVLVAILAWMGFAYYLSRHADPRLSGAGFIIRGIEKRGENPKRVPRSLLEQEVEEAIVLSTVLSGVNWENKSQRARWNRIFLEDLDGRAMIIAHYLASPSHEFFKLDADGKNYFVEKFKEHGL